MRIARFGDTYAAAYTFGAALMDDNWQSDRPPVAQAVSGASGAFDYYGSNNYPIMPVTANKKFAITGTSSADLEDSLITLRAATIATDRSKLWWLDRDDSTKYWSWAKCTRLRAVDTYKEKGRWVKLVDIDFYMPEGIWYGETQNTENDSISIGGAYTGDATIAVTNSGNISALVYITLQPANVGMIQAAARVKTGATAVSQWNFTGGVSDGTYLVVDARTYICTNASADAYSGLAVGDATLIDATDVDQVAWLWIPTGSYDLYIKVEGDTGGSTESVTYTIYWWHTYVF